MATIKYKKSKVESGVKAPKSLQKFTGYPVLSQPIKTPTVEEQDAIIADMLKAQGNMLKKKDNNVRRRIEREEAKLATKKRRQEIDEAAAAEMATYQHKVPAPARQQSAQTTVTAAPDVRSVGKTVTRVVEQRTGQGDFRNRVSMNFGGSCAISGHNVSQSLQAAHIAPFSSDKNNNTSNGIYMDASLHLLFDNHLMSIDPDTLTVHFKCKHPMAGLYEGVELKGHRVKLDIEALRIHWNLFRG